MAETIVKVDGFIEAFKRRVAAGADVATQPSDIHDFTKIYVFPGGLGLTRDPDEISSILLATAKEILGPKVTKNYPDPRGAIGGQEQFDLTAEVGFYWICDYGLRAALSVIRKAKKEPGLHYGDNLEFAGFNERQVFASACILQIQTNILNRPATFPEKFEKDLREAKTVTAASDVILAFVRGHLP